MAIKIRHIRCNMADFNADRHRFRFYYNGEEHIAQIYMAFHVIFDEKDEQTIPESVLCEVADEIYKSVRKNEANWRYPDEAYEIADAYCAEEFKL